MPSVSLDNYNQILNSYLSSLNSSALEAERQATRDANTFSANQAALNRSFQQTSAEKAMKFEAEQARLLREWNANQAAIDRAFQQSSADKQMAFQDVSIQKQMDFQQQMANTVYQRAVKDLQAAGLSPLLAYSNLQTSAPTGSSASGAAAAGAAASGSSARGISSSGSQATAFKGNYSSAKQADLKAFSEAISDVIFGLVSAKDVSSTLHDSGVGRFISDAVSSVKDLVVHSWNSMLYGNPYGKGYTKGGSKVTRDSHGVGVNF